MILGCNYWASNAGTEMWCEFDENVIRKDLEVLRAHGVEYLRVFPNWRDFQPVEPMLGAGASLKELRMVGGKKATNRYYLDEEMLARFARFCELCREFDMKLIVGLLTGFMSSRTFVPPALYGKHLALDPLCRYLEQLYMTGMVERFRDEPAIWAWDHGNECGNMLGYVDRYGASAWAQMLSNAIYAADRTRPLITGFNALSVDGIWRADEQGELCDMLVTHPYPYWGVHTQNDLNTYIKSTLYSAAQTRLYADLGKKPCLVEEIGTMGPAICSEELAADFLRVHFLSSVANGSPGLLWWCANEQSALMTPPYTWTMVENELGMRYADGSPKPVLKEMKRLSDCFADFTLPAADVDAVCLLTQGQDTWGVAYMTYILAKQAGLNIAFADAAKALPDAAVYLLPSIAGSDILPKESYLALKQRVANGAKLYISFDTGILTDFEELTGNRITDSTVAPESGTFELNGKTLPYRNSRKLFLEQAHARTVAPHITRAAYGKGEVWFVDFPVEAMLIDRSRAFDLGMSEIYRTVFGEELASHEIKLSAPDVALTVHRTETRILAVAVNHSEQTQKIDFKTDRKLIKYHYGTPDACRPMDGVIAEFSAE